MKIAIEIGRNEGSPMLARVHHALATPEQRVALMKIVGVEAEQFLRAWFYRLDAEYPNKHGWPRQHFWSRIGRRTVFEPAKTTDTAATILVSDPAFAAKVQGATIRPTGAVSPVTGKGTKNVAIPMQGAVYGAWPRGMPVPGLFFIRRSDGNGGYLVTSEGTGKERHLTYWYRLVPEVTVPKDPNALPPAADIGGALGKTALAFFRRQGGAN